MKSLTKRQMFCAGLIAVLGAGAAVRVPAADHGPVAVKDLSGAKHAVPDPKMKATVLFFITHDCPISNLYAPEMNRICAAYGPKGVAFYEVYEETDYSDADIRKHAHDFGYTCPLLHDVGQSLAKLTHATVTPEAVVLTSTGRPAYLGRIDDLYLDFGKARYRATTHDLRDALDAVLADKPVPHPTTKAVGCYIPTP